VKDGVICTVAFVRVRQFVAIHASGYDDSQLEKGQNERIGRRLRTKMRGCKKKRQQEKQRVRGHVNTREREGGAE